MTTTISRLLICSTASIAALLAGGAAHAATQCTITFSNSTSLYNASSSPSTDLCARSGFATNNVYDETCGSKSVEMSSSDSYFFLGMKYAGFLCQPPSGGFSALPCNYADPDGHGYGPWKWTAGGTCPGTPGPNCVVPDWCTEARSASPSNSSGEMYIYTNDFSFFNLQSLRLGQFSYTFANFPVSTNDITLYWWDSVNGYYQAVTLKSPPRGNGFYRFSNIYTDFIFIDNNDPSLPGFTIDDFTVTTY